MVSSQMGGGSLPGTSLGPGVCLICSNSFMNYAENVNINGGVSVREFHHMVVTCVSLLVDSLDLSKKVALHVEESEDTIGSVDREDGVMDWSYDLLSVGLPGSRLMLYACQFGNVLVDHRQGVVRLLSVVQMYAEIIVYGFCHVQKLYNDLGCTEEQTDVGVGEESVFRTD